LEGFCPVTLAEKQQWVAGDRRWGVVHRGRTYLFAGPLEQRQFQSNPDRFSPANSCLDPVADLDSHQRVEGQRRFGVRFEGRMYLFASEANRNAFQQNAKRYSAAVLQAENPNRTTTLR
jgi:protein disulfide-isomerase